MGKKYFALNDDNAVFTSINIEVSNDTITKVVGSFDTSDDDGEYSCTVEYVFSNIGTTSFTLPDVAPTEVEAPEHIDPSSAASLTEEQANILTQALSADFDKYELDYVYQEDYITEKEHDVVDNGKYAIDYYYDYSFGAYSAFYYFELTSDNKFYVYEDEARNCKKTELQTQSEVSQYAPYACSPVDFYLNTSSFGYKDGVYVATVSGLKAESQNFVSDQSTELFSLNIKLGSDNNVSSIDIILKTEDEYGTSFSTMSYTYSNIGNPTVNLPSVGSTLIDVTTEQKAAFTEAIGKEYYSNVTVMDTLFGSEFYFAGDDIRAYVPNEDDTMTVTDYKIVDGKYYEVTENGNEEMNYEHTSDSDETSFDYFVPVVNFTSIDTDKLVYDTFRNCYYIKGEDISLTEFAYYFYSDLITTLDGVTFTLNDDNTINTINIEFTSDVYGTIEGYGLAFEAIGTTTIE